MFFKVVEVVIVKVSDILLDVLVFVEDVVFIFVGEVKEVVEVVDE